MKSNKSISKNKFPEEVLKPEPPDLKSEPPNNRVVETNTLLDDKETFMLEVAALIEEAQTSYKEKYKAARTIQRYFRGWCKSS